MSHEGKMRRGEKWSKVTGVSIPSNYQEDIDYFLEHSKPVVEEVKKGRPKKES